VNRPERLRIEAMLDDALRVYRANQADGADPVSIAFDAGRIDGIKQVLRAIEANAMK
jgi:hypothetical protein